MRMPAQEEAELLQTRSVAGQPRGRDARWAEIAAMPTRGRELPVSERAFFEPRFGHSFSQVRVHTGALAAGAADGLNARAFTVERDIVFGANAYAPGTASGRRLFAHELTMLFSSSEEVSEPHVLDQLVAADGIVANKDNIQNTNVLQRLPISGRRAAEWLGRGRN